MENNTEKNIIHGNSRYRNIGGITCYINSILSILQQAPIFTDYIINGHFSKNIIKNIKDELIKEENENDDKEIKENDDENYKLYVKIINKVSYQLYQLFKASHENDNYSITPTSFKKTIGKKNPMWNEYNHQDSQEFFNFLISTMEEETGRKVDFIPGSNFKIENNKNDPLKTLLKLKAQSSWENFIKNEYSALKLIFNGLQYSKQKCDFCNNISNSFQTFTTLQINIPLNKKNPQLDFNKTFTLTECLNDLIQEEKLDYNNRLTCELCKRKNKASKQTKIWKPPKILVIHIKRFHMDMFGRVTRKICNKVLYPIIDFNIEKYIHEDSPYRKQNMYNLFGINLHQEFGHLASINSGHYTSILKNRHEGNFYHYNDHYQIEKVDSVNILQNKNAYLLFYYRK